MLFKDLQANTPFFIIENSANKFKVHTATVVNVSQPRFENNLQQFSNKVIDLNVNYNNQSLTYTINENAENVVFAPNNTILIIDNQHLVAQLKSLKLGCENTIKEAENAKVKVELIDRSLEEYDITFKEKREYDEKFDKLSNQVAELNTNFQRILEKLDKN
ncbi:MAG: hypothetical protein J6Z01_15115 [Bacteroidales bacterium]|nr:hypothetical protein [Bacteroidales bacterium]